jgi:hypothetical protein
LGNWLAGFLDRFPVVCNLVVLCGIFGVWLDSFLHASRFHIGFFYFYSSRGRMEGIEPVTWMPGSPFDATLWSVPYWVIAAPFAILFCYHLVVHQRERKRGAEAGKNNGPI